MVYMQVMYNIGEYILPFALKLEWEQRIRFRIPFAITIEVFTKDFFLCQNP